MSILQAPGNPGQFQTQFQGDKGIPAMGPKQSSRDTQLADDLKKEVVSAMSADSSLTPQTAMMKITKEMLANNPFVTPSGCPVNSLPPELLAHIFVVGMQMEEEGEEVEEDEDFDMADFDLKDGWTDEEDVDPDELDAGMVARLKSKGKVEQRADGAMDVDGEDESSEEDEEEEEEMFLPFQVLVSHVCRHWREVAIETPELWTMLTFTEGAPFEKSRIWIQRAKGGPLDIEIDYTFSDDEDDDDDDDDNEPQPVESTTALYGHQHATNLNHIDCFHACAHPPFSLSDFKQILDIIAPLVAQWRSLVVSTSTWEYMHTLLSRLSECPSAPLLETLKLRDEGDSEDDETFSPAELKEPFLIFNGNAPKLHDVTLWGVHLDWDRSLTLLSDLHDLGLAYHTEDVRPSFATFTQIIASSPNLRTLSLCQSGPRENDCEENNWGTDIIEISSLKELTFSDHKNSYATVLLQKLSVPNVHSLELDFYDEDYTKFVKQLTLPMPKTNKSILAGLEHIKISGLPCNRASMESMLGQLAGLKTFTIKCFGEEEQEIFKQLFPVNMTAGGSTTQNRRIYCPNLHTLKSTGICGAEMRKFVEARSAAGVPIKQLKMSDEDVIDEAEIMWLRDHVEELNFFEESDEEFDEEEVVDEFTLWDDDDMDDYA
ncbi:hypothetical protein C0995_004679 [Termitomyces sp. Mi166|nr:hypothetical protein C0995_004679 [Termitomyces sp. Mi166\